MTPDERKTLIDGIAEKIFVNGANDFVVPAAKARECFAAMCEGKTERYVDLVCLAAVFLDRLEECGSLDDLGKYRF